MNSTTLQNPVPVFDEMESSAIKIECCRQARKLEELREEWTELLNRSSLSSAFMTWEWMMGWLETFGTPGTQVILVCVRDESGRLIALAPMMKERVLWRELIPVNRIRLLGTGEAEEDEVCSEYLDFIVADGEPRAQIVQKIFSWLQENEQWDDILLEPVAEQSSLYEALSNVDHHLSVRADEIAPSFYLPLPGTWEEFLAGLGSNQRARIRKSIRELEKMGEVQLEVANLHQEPGPVFESLVKLHQERWNNIGKPGVFASSRFIAFHKGLIARLREQNGVFLASLKLNQSVIGSVYCLLHNSRAYFYQSGIDTEVSENNSRIKPGLAIHALVIKHLIDKGITEYDFLAGDNNNYKSRWTKLRRKNYRIVISRGTFGVKLISYVDQILRTVRAAMVRK